MSVLVETTLGQFTIDLNHRKAPKTCDNFIKLCKLKQLNFALVSKIFRNKSVNFTPLRNLSALAVIDPNKNPPAFVPEFHDKLRHDKKGIVSMSVNTDGLCATQFFITLTNDLSIYDDTHAVIGKGLDVLDKINSAVLDNNMLPFIDIRIIHTAVLDDPFPDPKEMRIPSRSPSPTPSMLTSRLTEAHSETPLLPPAELDALQRQQEATAHALTLELVGDLPFAEIKPPDQVLFVCKLNPITRDTDLHLIFSRFGECSVRIVRDDDGKSLGYSFIEYENKEDAEMAYLKMDKVLIDDRRIHVDFSQSVSKLQTDFVDLRNDDGEDFGGVGLRKRTLYRADSSRSRRGEEYDMVFENKNVVNNVSSMSPPQQSARDVVDSRGQNETSFARQRSASQQESQDYRQSAPQQESQDYRRSTPQQESQDYRRSSPQQESQGYHRSAPQRESQDYRRPVPQRDSQDYRRSSPQQEPQDYRRPASQQESHNYHRSSLPRDVRDSREQENQKDRDQREADDHNRQRYSNEQNHRYQTSSRRDGLHRDDRQKRSRHNDD